MNSIPSMYLGIQGINKGMDGLRRNAREITSLTTDVKEITSKKNGGLEEVAGSMVDMKINRLQIEASAKVVETASEMIGTIIDITA